ncbi:MAG: MATE family efflux transporter [Bacteroidales bacterium]|jgi:putative MATE family efflux protein|nr:MATE family efflux transporter [Bacteroidales bacterium]MBR5810137.1 MATE family efflux transporter [Bacteroidales bacterium]
MDANKSIPTELGTEKISKLLKQYALPAIIAQTASSLYNMVDSIFIGHGVGPLAISGLAVTFPLMNLSTAFGTLVGMGAASLMSILLGQKNYNAANKVLGNVVSLNIILGVLFMIAALVFIDPILYFFGASENTLPYAKDYMKIILYGNIITHLYFGLNAQMRSSGFPKKAMMLTIFTVVLNTILDPIFIFTFDMGIKGAAWATVIAQTASLVIVMRHFNDKSRGLHFEKGIIRLDWRIAKESLSIGFGPFLMNAAACLVTLFINQQLRRYAGDLGIGAFGICNRISFMFIMICLGLNQGMQPIAGYNFGARKYSRVKEVFWKTVGLATIATSLCFIICVLLPKTAVSIFTHDPELMEMSAKGLRTMNSMVLIIGAHIVSTNLFQCLGMVRKSIILSLSRQILFLLPLLYLLPLKWGETGVWLSYPISDVMSCVLAFTMLGTLFKKFGKMNDGDSPADLGIKF